VSIDSFCTSVSTLYSSSCTIERLARDTGTLLGADDSFRYHSVVGGLQYDSHSTKHLICGEQGVSLSFPVH
jgi:hypothetical protein